jgi:subtilisin family serine protease
VRATHSELRGRVAAGMDFTGEGMHDGNGHGSHVAGTCAGTTYGVAKGATIVPVKVLNTQGSGSYAAILAGIDWVKTQHEQSQGDRSVANLSLGGGYSAAINAAIEACVRAGVVVVVAAGNESMDACATSPASAQAAITVASIDDHDARSGFSNFGTCVDIFAPGSAIKSASGANDSGTATLSGTSMAAPHVAGAAALVLQSDPRLSGRDVWSVLNGMSTLNVVSSPGSSSPNKLLYVGDIQAAKPPPTEDEQPTGRVTFTIQYDTYPEETSFGLWELAGKQWHELHRYKLPASKAKAMTGRETVVTRHFRNGFYAFDIKDRFGDGIASGYADAGYVNGSFKITESDTGKIIYQGGDFDTYFSVEFIVKDGVISLSDVIAL